MIITRQSWHEENLFLFGKVSRRFISNIRWVKVSKVGRRWEKAGKQVSNGEQGPGPLSQGIVSTPQLQLLSPTKIRRWFKGCSESPFWIPLTRPHVTGSSALQFSEHYQQGSLITMVVPRWKRVWILLNLLAIRLQEILPFGYARPVSSMALPRLQVSGYPGLVLKLGSPANPGSSCAYYYRLIYAVSTNKSASHSEFWQAKVHVISKNWRYTSNNI